MTIPSQRRTRPATRTSRRPLHYLPVTALALDSVILTCATAIAIRGREELPFFYQPAVLSEPLEVIGPLLLMGWLLMITIRGGYKENVFGVGLDEYKRLISASLLTTGLLGVGCYLARFQLSRGFFALEFAVGIPLLVLGRFLLRRAVCRARARGLLRHRVLIAGSLDHIDEIAGVLSRETWLGYHVVGALTPTTDTEEETPGGVPVLGNACDAGDLILQADADVLFFASGAFASARDFRGTVWELEKYDVQVVVAPSVTDVSGERVRIRPVGGLPLMHLDPPRATDASRWGKRIFDIVGSIGLLVLFAPLLLVAAVWVKRSDGGSVVFRQARVGRYGAPFECLKLRTMVVDAESRLPALRDREGHSDGLFKLKDDPRVTPPGRWLRRYSIDELPQLVNVLRGEMSLIGPRPPLPHEVSAYDAYASRRLQVRPGMTGLWQVSGRSDLSWEETLRLDLYYVDNWSMLQDLVILLRTLKAVLSSRRAY